ncbi:Protein of unknown function domain containing protein [Aphelenchoides besseyi]|nr:Protein of unknown function domain containing protein [Aphelenchoides besseyi]KAI6193060.1 Protein of unknown function domain containing protein [Aphelenchoides besseyi]
MLKTSQIRSSLPLEILLYVNSRLAYPIFVLLVGIYIYKSTYLNYPNHMQIFELLILLTYAPLETLRISWARRGNLTETPTFISFALLLGVAVLAICVHVAFFQNFVMLVERICVGVEGVFVILESVFSVAAVASFSRGRS